MSFGPFPGEKLIMETHNGKIIMSFGPKPSLGNEGKASNEGTRESRAWKGTPSLGNGANLGLEGPKKRVWSLLCVFRTMLNTFS